MKKGDIVIVKDHSRPGDRRAEILDFIKNGADFPVVQVKWVEPNDDWQKVTMVFEKDCDIWI